MKPRRMNENEIAMKSIGVELRPASMPIVVIAWIVAIIMHVGVVPVCSSAADRTVMFLPIGSTAGNSNTGNPVVDVPVVDVPGSALPNRAADRDAGWQSMIDLWQAHHAQPDNVDIRRFLGLPLDGESDFNDKRSRTAPSWLGWRPGEYAEIDTPHFTIYSHADRAATQAVAIDIERCYWAWTQFFFPLWEAAPQVTLALANRGDGVSIAQHLSQRRSRLSLRRKLRVVLFRDAQQYARTLSGDVPGIERSTGFYSDTRKTMCLYAGEVDDAATRRHELVHQLFREATRCKLGRGMPGETSSFWLIEGIAGYFESLHIDGDRAIVGGWDSPRLQFARYRILVGGDTMSIGQLQPDGRLAAQNREDLARWYAHAIAQTHRLIDGSDTNGRIWVYRQLADLYKIDCDLPAASDPDDSVQSMTSFLGVNDQALIDNPSRRPLQLLCLANCQVTPAGLESVGPQPALTWLDLARLPVGDDAVKSLLVAPERMEQLTLEATGVTPGIAPLIAKMPALHELDLSWTSVDDSVLDAIVANEKMSVLWLTGTKISDASIAKITAMPKLESVDVQRTMITPVGMETLKQNTSATVNPLELRSSP